MNTQTKFTNEFAAVRFAGYAALFDQIDAGRDVIRKGAFEKTVRDRRIEGKALPLLWQHRPDQQIGWVERVGEDAKGLRVVARIDDPASGAAMMLKDRKITGLSFGYRTRAARAAALGDGRQGRELAEVELFEISLVSRPMQNGARVHFIV